jgi:hypothetical protein
MRWRPLCLCLLMTHLFLACNTRRDAFQVAFGCERPQNIAVLNEQLFGLWDSNQIVFYGKYSGSKSAFLALATSLSLSNAVDAAWVVPSDNRMKWWSPPSPEDQLFNSDRFCFYEPRTDSEHPAQMIVTVYTNGVVYLFKNGLGGQRGHQLVWSNSSSKSTGH